MRRPRWIVRSRRWVVDGVWDGRPSFQDVTPHPGLTRLGRVLDVVDLDGDRWARWVEQPWLRAECRLFGHITVDDQCGKAEHRFCLVCGTPRPNLPVDG